MEDKSKESSELDSHKKDRHMDDSSQPFSFASNALSSNVNFRTGELSINIAAPKLPGILDMDIDLGIGYNQSLGATYNSFLGLPPGWLYALSFISSYQIHINGGQIYPIDPSSPAGMQNYKLKNLRLDIYDSSSLPVFPYDNNQYYAYCLNVFDGHKQYFDAWGKLIGTEDKNTNHILYYYDQVGQDVYNCRLGHIVDTHGQIISLSYDDNAIDISFPLGGKNHIQFLYQCDQGYNNLLSYVDPVGENTAIVCNGGIQRSNLVSDINYSNQLARHFDYSTIYYKTQLGNIVQKDVVSAVTDRYKADSRVIKYNFNPDYNDHNFLGYPTYQCAPSGTDTLFISNDNNYRYTCQQDDGVLITKYFYNNLHLPMKKQVFASTNMEPVSEETYTYTGQGPDGYFPVVELLPANYQTPVSIITEYFDSAGNQGTSVKTKKDTSFNDTGQVINVKRSEQASSSDDWLVVNESVMGYDARFGMQTQKDLLDYKPDGIFVANSPRITRMVNSLSADGRYCMNKQVGPVNIIGEEKQFVPEREYDYQYDPEGRCSFKSIKWAGDSDKKPQPHQVSYQITYAFDASKCLITKTKTHQKGASTLKIHDSTTGLLQTIINAEGFKVNYTYDDLGRELSRTDPIGQVTTWSYDNSLLKLTKTKANGYKTFTTYNGFNDIGIKSDNAGLGEAERQIEIRSYDFAGRPHVKTGLLGSNSSITYEYNNRGLLQSTQDALGNISKHTYDSVNRIKTTFFNGFKTLTQYYDCSGKVNLYQQESSEEEDEPREVWVEHNGNYALTGKQWGKEDNTNKWTRHSYGFNIYNRLTSKIKTGWDGAHLSENLVLDLFNKIVSNDLLLEVPGEKDSSGSSSALTRNEDGLLVTEENLLSQVISYHYDNAGNTKKITQFDGSTITFTYYANNKVKTKEYTDIDGTRQQLQFTYYPGSKLLSSIESKREGILQYEYTLDGKIKKITYPDGRELKWKYDQQLNQLCSITDAAGEETIYKYDPYGRLSKVSRGNQYVLYEYYDIKTDPANSGQISTINYSAGFTISYKYNGYGTVHKMTISSKNCDNMITVVYAFDLNSRNITSETFSSSLIAGDNGNFTKVYNYDTLGRLSSTQILDAGGRMMKNTEFTMDALNNVTVKKITIGSSVDIITYHYDTDNKLLSIEEKGQQRTLEYDQNGNLHKDGLGNTSVYNTLGQLISYTDNSGNVTLYSYYLNGLRKSKQVGNAIPVYYYYDFDKIPNVVNEIQEDSSAGYMMAGSMRFMREVRKSGQTTSTHYCFSDRKDVLLVVAADGTVEKFYNYEAFGLENDSSSNNLKDGFNINENPFRYSNYYLDSESNLYYLLARYYDPLTMRFNSRDRLHVSNHYSYTNGNPVMKTDASGHAWWDWLIFGITMLVSIVETVVTFGAAAPEAALIDAAELGSIVGDSALAGAESAEVTAETAAETAAESGAEDLSFEGDNIAQRGGAGGCDDGPLPPNYTNPNGLDNNCVFCAAAHVAGTTAPEVAESVGMEEGFVESSQDIFNVFKESNLTQGEDFDLVTQRFDNAKQFMESESGGSRFIFGYRTGQFMNHYIYAESDFEGGLSFFDPQSDTQLDDMPFAKYFSMDGPNYSVLRVFEAMDTSEDWIDDIDEIMSGAESSDDEWGPVNNNINNDNNNFWG